MLPALGEIIKTADDNLEIYNVSAGLRSYISKLNETIFDKTEIVHQLSMPMIEGSVYQLKELVGMLKREKQDLILKQKPLINDVFKSIRQK